MSEELKVQMTDVHKAFGKKVVLDGVDQIADDLLDTEIISVVLFEKKVRNLCTGQWKINFIQHV